MEHRKKGRKLKRTASHKKALLSNLATSLIKNKRIKTTVAKAKELRTFIEPLITKAKRALLAKNNGTSESAVHYFRLMKRFIKDKEASNILMGEVAEKVKNRNGGYTRILKTGFRRGDGAEEAIIELVDFAVAAEKSEGTKKKTTKKVKTKAPSEEVKSETSEAKATETEEKSVKKTTRKKTSSEKTEKAKKSTTRTKESKEEPERKKTTRKPKPRKEE
ncbi:MAG: 50S ribosomal protein L17 [Ignavibacteria bacterium]